MIPQGRDHRIRGLSDARWRIGGGCPNEPEHDMLGAVPAAPTSSTSQGEQYCVFSRFGTPSRVFVVDKGSAPWEMKNVSHIFATKLLRRDLGRCHRRRSCHHYEFSRVDRGAAIRSLIFGVSPMSGRMAIGDASAQPGPRLSAGQHLHSTSHIGPLHTAR
jgi:hypothetical protein